MVLHLQVWFPSSCSVTPAGEVVFLWVLLASVRKQEHPGDSFDNFPLSSGEVNTLHIGGYLFVVSPYFIHVVNQIV
jgi:hypothetical protein